MRQNGTNTEAAISDATVRITIAYLDSRTDYREFISLTECRPPTRVRCDGASAIAGGESLAADRSNCGHRHRSCRFDNAMTFHDGSWKPYGQFRTVPILLGPQRQWGPFLRGCDSDARWPAAAPLPP